MWKVGGIKIEGTQARNSFCRWTGKSVKNENILLFGPLLGNEEEILGWVIQGKIIAIHREAIF